MSGVFSRQQLVEAIQKAQAGSGVGVGLYRNGYREFGIDFWGTNPASEVQYFLDRVIPPEEVQHLTLLDIAAGTGKNLFEFARLGISHAVAVEIDSIGTSHMLNALISLEEAGLLPENKVTIVKDDALRFLKQHTGQYNIVVCYGLLHVFKDPDQLKNAISLIQKTVAPGGYLILQAITDRYPAPAIQPELEGVIVNPRLLSAAFRENIWKVVHVNNADIVHSHAGSEENHRHGSIRLILRRI